MKPCQFCTFVFDVDKLGKYGCPNCNGEGLEAMREMRCKRGHAWMVTRLEFEAYKGALPMPCPTCTREGRP